MPLLDGSHAAVGNIIRALPPSENARRTYCGFQATGERLRLLIMKTSVAQPSCPARLLPAADTGPSGSPPDLSSGRRFLQNEGLPRLSPHLDCWLTALPLSSQGLSAPGSASPLSQGHQSCETTVPSVAWWPPAESHSQVLGLWLGTHPSPSLDSTCDSEEDRVEGSEGRWAPHALPGTPLPLSGAPGCSHSLSPEGGPWPSARSLFQRRSHSP